MDPYTPEGKAAANIALQNLTAGEGSHAECLFPDGRCLGALLWNACDDLGILSWLISTRRDCSGWEDRVALSDDLCAGTLGVKQARGPLSLFRMEKMP